MFLCYMIVNRNNQSKAELCIVPDKVDPLASPILIRELFPTTSAVFRVGAEEAMTVSADEQDGQMVITALEPASVYLTPNLAAFPGMRARRIKIVPVGEGVRTYYAKDRNSSWEEWVANRERK